MMTAAGEVALWAIGIIVGLVGTIVAMHAKHDDEYHKRVDKTLAELREEIQKLQH